jgi:hypothetical protein
MGLDRKLAKMDIRGPKRALISGKLVDGVGVEFAVERGINNVLLRRYPLWKLWTGTGQLEVSHLWGVGRRRLRTFR